MSIFQALYGKGCNIPINQSDLVNSVLLGPYMLAKMEQEMQVIKNNLKVTQDIQKSYAYQYREFKEFQVGEHVYLHIKPKKISLRIRSCAKLKPSYCRPFKVLERIGPVAYKLSLLMIVKFHDLFHVSFLKIYVKDINHVIDWFVLQVDAEG